MRPSGVSSIFSALLLVISAVADSGQVAAADVGRRQTLSLNDRFEFPFLGTVRVHSKIETVVYEDAVGATVPFKLKACYTKEGHFQRAEFARPGIVDPELPPREAERNYGSERIVGVPKEAPSVSLQKLLNNLRGVRGGEYWKATKFNITYVLREEFGKTKPAFIVNLFGTTGITEKLPDTEPFRRLRFVFGRQGELLFIDNTL